ncbi:HAD family phosphatase [Glaciecola sp. XM2]|uniref:HAD family hydrolase n=1 Tax=Glaciecola sp. XM2 TaxID=1914931 RepID=UPI001BDE1B32|nr:HAD family phosphatase [Glaciecola sp. XM2]MBT1450756.1 HAD family phosphatase [Glaciecola sp. XM2]
MQFDAILFDKDGTIFDSEHSNKSAWLASTKAFGIEYNDADYQRFVGLPTQACFDMAKREFPADFPWSAFLDDLRERLRTNFANGVPFKKGFEAFFAHAKTLNIPLGLVTSAQRTGTELSFQHSGYLNDFSVIVTVDDVSEAKPSPEAYLLACSKLQVDPAKTLVFEDSSVGVQAAVAAKCVTVAIPDFTAIDPALVAQCHASLANFEQAYRLFK